MLLAIDVGNTNTVFAVYKGDVLLNSWRLRSDAARSPDEYAAFLNELFKLSDISWDTLKDVMISSVVPDANFQLQRFCQKYLACEPVFVGKDMAQISVDVERPEDVGADRLVNAVAVKAYYRYPAIVIDFGTATTFDVIDAQGAYAGGVIAPGINLSMAALHQAASKLPKISVQKPKQAIGKNTIGAMQSGVYFGYKGLIDEIVEQIAAELGGAKPFILATGGLAPLFAKDSALIDEVDEHLTLKGLQILYKQNKT